MVDIINLDECELSSRAGTYGGKAGFKDGIIYKKEFWIVKYPKNTAGMRVEDMSYSTAPLSEYIGSQIYRILGFPVHETFLAFRNNKIVVACKDFCKYEGQLREVRTIKNLANPELAELLERNFSETGSGATDIEELLLHIKYNDILSNVDGIEQRFWDCIVIDALINNNDRNNGNWGVLREQNRYVLAPIFDNGACFSNKVSDERIRKFLMDESLLEASVTNTVSTYGKDGKHFNIRKLFEMDYEQLYVSLERLYPVIVNKFEEIKTMINDIPEMFGDLYVCSKERKLYYLRSMEMRMNKIFRPALERRGITKLPVLDLKHVSIGETESKISKDYDDFER